MIQVTRPDALSLRAFLEGRRESVASVRDRAPRFRTAERRRGGGKTWKRDMSRASSHARAVMGLLAVGYTVVGQVLSAQLIDTASLAKAVRAEPLRQLKLFGPPDDRAYVQSLVAYCTERSSSFRTGLTAVSSDSVRTNLALIRQFSTPPGILFDRWGTDEQIVDLDDLDLLPPFRSASDTWTAGTAPSWSPTKCGLLGHFLIEAWYTQSQMRQAKVRLALPDAAVATIAHQRAREVEEAIEGEMGRTATKICAEAMQGADGTNWFVIHLRDVVNRRRYEVRFERIGPEVYRAPQYCESLLTCKRLLPANGERSCVQ